MHVFVETNFLVELLRPFPGPAATLLYERAQKGEVALHVPWVAVAEARRTLVRKTDEDLGFTDQLVKFAVAQLRAGKLARDDKKVIDKLAEDAKRQRSQTLAVLNASIDDAVRNMRLIPPTEQVVSKVLALHAIKELKPWDELVLGAVLVRAAELRAAGEQGPFAFCNLDKKDFSPARNPSLAAEYATNGIEYHHDFGVP